MLVIGQGQDHDNQFLGHLLRRRRTDLGRRTEDVARAIKVTASYIRLIERGGRAPAPDKALELLTELDFSPEQISNGRLRFHSGTVPVVIRFKHWTSDAPVGAARAFIAHDTGPFDAMPIAAVRLPATGSVLGAAVGAVTGWLPVRSPRQRGVAELDSTPDDALLGRIMRRIAGMSPRDLRLVAEAIEDVDASSRRSSVRSGPEEDDDVTDAEIVDE